MTNGKHLVLHVDGSTRPTNPGYSGYGLFGYTLFPSKRPTKVKHPIKNKLYFTTVGLSETPDTDPYETMEIVEHIGSIPSATGTNNLAELLGFTRALMIASSLEVSKLTVLTDSSYVVNNYNDNLKKWKEANWSRQDGKPVAHPGDWSIINELTEELIAKGCEINAQWTKGHSGDHGNDIADLYANVGSNYSRQQHEAGVESFVEVAYGCVSTYKDYKDSLLEKDIIYYFRDLFFSSSPVNDTTYCFLSSSNDPMTLGKRDTTSIFVTSVGYVPEVINDIKVLFRSVPRNYINNCCIKLNRLEDKELARLAKCVGIEKMVRFVEHRTGAQLYLVKDTSPFVTEYTYEYPYIVEASKVFGSSLDAVTNNKDTSKLNRKDVTGAFVQDGKIAFSNSEKNVDLTGFFSDDYNLTTTLLATVGCDIPNYLALKSIEGDIKSVTAICELPEGTNRLSLFIAIETHDRTLCSVNIVNKFMVHQ